MLPCPYECVSLCLFVFICSDINILIYLWLYMCVFNNQLITCCVSVFNCWDIVLFKFCVCEYGFTCKLICVCSYDYVLLCVFVFAQLCNFVALIFSPSHLFSSYTSLFPSLSFYHSSPSSIFLLGHYSICICVFVCVGVCLLVHASVFCLDVYLYVGFVFVSFCVLSVCLFVCAPESFNISLCVSLCLFVNINIYICMWVWVFFFVCVCMGLCIYMWFCVYICICAFTWLCVCGSVYIYICLCFI